MVLSDGNGGVAHELLKDLLYANGADAILDAQGLECHLAVKPVIDDGKIAGSKALGIGSDITRLPLFASAAVVTIPEVVVTTSAEPSHGSEHTTDGC